MTIAEASRSRPSPTEAAPGVAGRRRLGRADWLGAAAVVALVLAAFFEVAFLGKTFSASGTVGGLNGSFPPTGFNSPGLIDYYRVDRGASTWVFEPWAVVTHRALASGQLPLWNPYQGNGAPLAAAMQGSVFDPLMVLVRISPTLLAWDLTFLACFVLGALAAYVFARLIGLGPLASVVASGAFILSGFFMLYSNNHFFRGYLYLPALCALIELTLRSRRLLPVLGFGAGVAGSLLVGMPEVSFFVLTTAAAYALYRVIFGPRSVGRVRAVLRLAAGGLFGVALAAPQLLLFFEYLAAGFNTHGSAGPGLQADPPHLMLNWMLPFINGRPLGGRVGTGWSGTRNWMGMGIPILAVVAASSPSAMRRHHGCFFGAFGVLALLKIFGVEPVQRIGTLPVADRAIFQVFSSPIPSFCAAVLGGVGVQALTIERRRRLLLMLPGLAALGLLLARLLEGNREVVRTATDALSRRQIVVAGASVALVMVGGLLPRARIGALLGAGILVAESQLLLPTGGATRWRLALLALAALLIVAAVVRRPRQVGALMAGAAVLAELLLCVPRGIYTDRLDPYARPGWMDFVSAGPQGEPPRMLAFEALLYPDTAGAIGLQDIRALDAMYVERYLTYIRTFVEPEFDDRWVSSNGDETTRPDIQDNPMFDLLGVHSLLTPLGDLESVFLNRLFAIQPITRYVNLTEFDIGGDRRTVFFEHAPAETVYPLHEQQPTGVSLAYALHPGAWDDPAADGVSFSIDAVTALGRRTVWRAEYVPAVDPVRPEWRTADVDLTGLGGPVTALVFRTEQRGAPTRDWAGWASVVVHTAGPQPFGGTSGYRFAGVTPEGIKVYRNERKLPRAFVVDTVHQVDDEKAALRFFAGVSSRFADNALRVTGFDPRREAVVEAPPGEFRRIAHSPSPGPPAGSARFRSYTHNKVVIDVLTDRAGLLVLTDTYYPGWKATVRGRPAPVLPVDLAFRGVVVPAGESTVVFRYRPDSFRLGVAIAGVALLAALGLGLRGRHRRTREGAVVL